MVVYSAAYPIIQRIHWQFTNLHGIFIISWSAAPAALASGSGML